MSFDPRPYAEGIKRLNDIERRRIDERADRARMEAKRLAARIAGLDGEVRRVLLFGSLAAGSPTRLDFDIDLALDGGDVNRAMAVAEDSPYDVDIVSVDLVPDHVRTSIFGRGIPVFTR